ncbi:hypothetical protein OH492_05090 [Vibrio chagasii]|nr:hypothetical protein [Vibrio chagasii]
MWLGLNTKTSLPRMMYQGHGSREWCDSRISARDEAGTVSARIGGISGDYPNEHISTDGLTLPRPTPCLCLCE